MKLENWSTADYKFIGFERKMIQIEYRGIISETSFKAYHNEILILQR
jgi:hypothetical protein